jgi:hypothetical protein
VPEKVDYRNKVYEPGFGYDDKDYFRKGAIIAACLTAFWALVIGLYFAANAIAAPAKVHPIGKWQRALITTYSWAEGGSHEQACTSRPLQNWHRTFAARDYQVPCGGRVQFCYRERCVVGRRTDSSGGGVAYDSLDLNRGLALALHLPSSVITSADGSYSGGYASVAWRRVR